MWERESDSESMLQKGILCQQYIAFVSMWWCVHVCVFKMKMGEPDEKVGELMKRDIIIKYEDHWMSTKINELKVKYLESVSTFKLTEDEDCPWCVNCYE